MPHALLGEHDTLQDDIELLDAASDYDSAQETSPQDVKAEQQTRSLGGRPIPSPVEEPKDLDNLFSDLEDEDIYGGASEQVALQNLSHASSFSNPAVMRVFYQRLFPFRYLFQWLNHSPTPSLDFVNREFSFTLPDDVVVRYQSFTTADLMRKQCVAQIPTRFDIGPVYSANPRDRKTLRQSTKFRPLAKELCFDIDMTDYDRVRTCCKEANICDRCWSFIRMAVKVVDVALREDFGFKHILWVYSGRRGVHAWVCDRRAREMDDAKRKAITGYMELLKGGDHSGKKVNTKRPLHPHLERSLEILRDHFQKDILLDQDPWQQPERSAHLLTLLQSTDKTLTESLKKKWEAAPSRSSLNKWKDIDSLASSGGGSDSLDTRKLRDTKIDIILEYTYPRIDAEVSKKLNHLLKSPFVVHPKTGRICVPFDASQLDNFDPLEVPTVTELLTQLDQWRENEDDAKSSDKPDSKRGIPDWDKTALKPYVDLFRTFVANLLKDEHQGEKRQREENDNAMEF